MALEIGLTVLIFQLIASSVERVIPLPVTRNLLASETETQTNIAKQAKRREATILLAWIVCKESRK